MKTQEEIDVIASKRIHLLEMEKNELAAFEEAVFSELWEDAARHSNRLHHVTNLRRILEVSVWED